MEQTREMPHAADVIVFGLGRYGKGVTEHLQREGLRIIGVDFDPEVVKNCRKEGLTVYFGDAEDPHLIEHLPLKQTQCIIVALPQISASDVNLTLVKILRQHGYSGAILAAAPSHRDAQRLLEAGATRVLLPFTDAAIYAADVIAEEILGVGEKAREQDRV